jgi:hypothetical protein
VYRNRELKEIAGLTESTIPPRVAPLPDDVTFRRPPADNRDRRAADIANIEIVIDAKIRRDQEQQYEHYWYQCDNDPRQRILGHEKLLLRRARISEKLNAFPPHFVDKSVSGHERRFRDVRDETGLPPTPERLWHRHETTLRANSGPSVLWLHSANLGANIVS